MFALGFLTAFNIFLLALVLRQRGRIRNLEKRYRSLLSGNRGLSLEETLNDYVAKTFRNETEIQGIAARQDRLEYKSRKAVSGIGLVRYNAFQETGGDLSFSAAFIDGEERGVVITGIMGREETRVYAKDIEAGKSGYLLSDEEKKAIELARSRNHEGKRDK